MSSKVFLTARTLVLLAKPWTSVVRVWRLCVQIVGLAIQCIAYVYIDIPRKQLRFLKRLVPDKPQVRALIVSTEPDLKWSIRRRSYQISSGEGRSLSECGLQIDWCTQINVLLLVLLEPAGLEISKRQILINPDAKTILPKV